MSGDGTNNQGQLVTVARDEVVAKGITINGLPIMLKRPALGSVDIEDLDIYYEDCVIGGPGAFVVPIRERDEIQGGDPHQAGAGDRRPHAASRASFRPRPRRRASPAPSASACGSSAGARGRDFN